MNSNLRRHDKSDNLLCTISWEFEDINTRHSFHTSLHHVKIFSPLNPLPFWTESICIKSWLSAYTSGVGDRHEYFKNLRPISSQSNAMLCLSHRRQLKYASHWLETESFEIDSDLSEIWSAQVSGCNSCRFSDRVYAVISSSTKFK